MEDVTLEMGVLTAVHRKSSVMHHRPSSDKVLGPIRWSFGTVRTGALDSGPKIAPGNVRKIELIGRCFLEFSHCKDNAKEWFSQYFIFSLPTKLVTTVTTECTV